MEVSRVVEHQVTRIEPPLDQHWPQQKKLEWKAAVVMLNCPGLQVDIRQFPYNWSILLRAEGKFSHSISISSYEAVWDYLNGVTTGWEMAAE